MPFTRTTATLTDADKQAIIDRAGSHITEAVTICLFGLKTDEAQIRDAHKELCLSDASLPGYLRRYSLYRHKHMTGIDSLNVNDCREYAVSDVIADMMADAVVRMFGSEIAA